MYRGTRATRLITVAICVRRLWNGRGVVVFWPMNNNSARSSTFGITRMHNMYYQPCLPSIRCDAAVGGRTKSSSGAGRTSASGRAYMRRLVGHNKHNNYSVLLRFLATEHTRFAQWRRGQRHIRRALLRRFSRTII